MIAAAVPCPLPCLPMFNAAASSKFMSSWPSPADVHVELHRPSVPLGIFRRVADAHAFGADQHPRAVHRPAEVHLGRFDCLGRLVRHLERGGEDDSRSCGRVGVPWPWPIRRFAHHPMVATGHRRLPCRQEHPRRGSGQLDDGTGRERRGLPADDEALAHYLGDLEHPRAGRADRRNARSPSHPCFLPGSEFG